jgi:hypothetical protein
MRRFGHVLSFPVTKSWRQEAVVEWEAMVVIPMETVVAFESSMHSSYMQFDELLLYVDDEFARSSRLPS